MSTRKLLDLYVQWNINRSDEIRLSFFFVPCSWILHLILKYQTRVLSRASFRFPVGSGGRPDNRCHERDDIDSRRAVRSLLWVAFVAVNHNFVSVFFNIRRPFFEVRAGYWTQIWKAKLNFVVIGLNPVAIDIPSVRLFKTSTITFSKKKKHFVGTFKFFLSRSLNSDFRWCCKAPLNIKILALYKSFIYYYYYYHY